MEELCACNIGEWIPFRIYRLSKLCPLKLKRGNVRAHLGGGDIITDLLFHNPPASLKMASMSGTGEQPELTNSLGKRFRLALLD